ncbi:zinc finger CCCH domain-containing protein 10-like [Amblyraja radiata]|uniref:zinc finger CCCH domain-containing protein 10-like n=1 Tax=Amblyraja radiata TaxID=386614 RepID=UPI0014025BFF|nr:zinc finger CCCH domain-containing protein 10-like [Amblyraja radiata]
MAGGSSGDVCRDFLRNVCKRGRRCKFLHPEVSEAADTAEEPALVRGEAPVCRDHQNGECQRGAKCKFRHFERESPEQVCSPIVYQMDPYHTELYEEQALKRRRLESLRFDLYDHGVPRPFPVDYHYLEEENLMLHKRVEELKKQASNLMATNEVLLEQNALYRNQPKVVTLTTTGGAEQQLAPPTVATVTAYNHTIVQAHNSLSSQALQPRQEMVAQANAVPMVSTGPAPPLPPPPGQHMATELALAQTIAQSMATPVTMTPVTVSITQAIPGITVSHATTPMVSYAIASQSMRITPMPH